MWLCNVVLGAKGRRGRSDSGEELAGEGWGRRGAGQGGHMRPTRGRILGSGGAGEWVPRRGGALAAAGGSVGEVAA
jgi:hypothetical protein